jgi:hyaluronan synthase
MSRHRHHGARRRRAPAATSSPTAGLLRYARRYWALIGALLLLACAVVATRHFGQFVTGQASAFIFVAYLSFGYLAVTLWMAHSHTDVVVTDPASAAYLAGLRVSIVMPVYNEDPETFRRALETIAAQTRPVQCLHVIDDGSRTDACGREMQRFVTAHPELECRYTYVSNNGKREAQAVAFGSDPAADVFVTMDSDTLLDPQAIENGLAPFADAHVMSVAGMLVGLNRRHSLLTRLVDLGYTNSTLNTRACHSRMRSVCVNQGPLALYRAFIPRKYLGVYLGHTFLGRKVVSGDDRMLTNFSLLEGRTVMQQTAVAATLLPTSIWHLTRQRVRWSRSFFRGGMWLIRHLPPTRTAWWLLAWRYVTFCLFTVMYPTILLIQPITEGFLPIAFFVYVGLLSYAKSARYLTVPRDDESALSQVLTYLMAPLSTVLHLYLSTILRYVGLLTIHSTGWGTRSAVEVGVAPATALASVRRAG